MEKQVAEWIWYPGEYEMLLGQRVWFDRCERGIHILPLWKVDTLYPMVQFRKTADFPEAVTLFPRASGGMTVELDRGGNYCSRPEEGISVSAGKHTLILTVFRAQGLPACYLDSPYMPTDSTWEVSWIRGQWKSAASAGFTDPSAPPDAFPFEEETIAPVSVETIGSGLLFDFGKERMAALRFEGVAGPGPLDIAYGESRSEALDTERCELYDRVNLAEGFTTPFIRAFRYVFLADGAERVQTVKALTRMLPLENRGAFRCEDERMNRIYDTAVYTLHLNCREFLFDGIKRDRWVWSGDATQSYLLNFYTFMDQDICRRTMRLLRGKDPIVTHLNTIQDYTCYWFISLMDYHQYTGDVGFLAELYEDAKGLMQFCLNRTDSRGFMNAQPGDWVFVDWAPIDNRGDVAVIQLLFARALEAMAEVAGVTGHPADAAYYRACHQQTLDSCFRVFWSESLGCFTHGPADAADAVVTRYPNLFALLFGYLRPEQRDSVIRTVLLSDTVQPITTPYMRFYELMALCEAGETDTVWKELEAYWGGMLDEGATTFWEEYHPDQTGDEHLAMYGRPYGKSLCHAWGAGPVLLLGKYFLGVRPTAPGYRTFEVQPHSPGQPLEGTVPAGAGAIHVTCSPQRVTVQNDTDGQGLLRWQGETYPIPPRQTVTIS